MRLPGQRGKVTPGTGDTLCVAADVKLGCGVSLSKCKVENETKIGAFVEIHKKCGREPVQDIQPHVHPRRCDY